MKTMKTSILITAILTALTFFSAAGQEQTTGDYIWKYQGRKKENTIGMYGGMSGSYSTFGDEPVMWLGAKAGLVFNGRWGVGLAGEAINYDKKLTALVDDGDYRLQAGYSGLFVEHIVPVKDWAKVRISWTTGMGVAFYQYNKEFRENRSWYNEYIDVERFAANKFDVGFDVRVAGNWWVGLQTGYRDTSPVKLEGTAADVFEAFNAGISLKYGIF